jgi:hypothetical protein
VVRGRGGEEGMAVARCEELVHELRRFIESGGAAEKVHRASSSLSGNVSQLLLLGDVRPQTHERELMMTRDGLIQWQTVTRQNLTRGTPEGQGTPIAEFRTAVFSLHAMVLAEIGPARDDDCDQMAALCDSTARLEQLLHSLCLARMSHADAPQSLPRVLRDLLETPVLTEAIGEDRVFFVKLLVGPPVGLNLRNIAWHGFVGPGECPSQYLALLEAASRSLLAAAGVEHQTDLPRQPLASMLQRRFAEMPGPEQLFLGDAGPSDSDWRFVRAALDRSLFVVGGRERPIEEGLRCLWKQVSPSSPTTLSLNEARRGLQLTLPQLEHCLRRVFVTANSLPAVTMSPDYRAYYTTVDIILQENVVLRGDQLVAVSFAAGVRRHLPKFANAAAGAAPSPSSSD